MINYKLEIIPGTKEFVLSEIAEKFSEKVRILNATKEIIRFESEIDDVDVFRSLKSPLYVEKKDGPKRNLFRRKWKIETAPAGINPALAFVMCQNAQINSYDIILDPFCGAGTIPITAAKYFKPKRVLASDVSGKAIDQTVVNLKAAKLPKGLVSVFRSNISSLRLSSESVTKIITNMPFGIRVSNHGENVKIYDSFFKKAKNILKPQGLLIILTQEKKLVLENTKTKLELQKEILIEQGKLFPSIFVYKKV